MSQKWKIKMQVSTKSGILFHGGINHGKETYHSAKNT